MRRGLISRSHIELPDAVLDKRVARLQAAMRAAGVDALMVYSNIIQPAGISWLTGFVPYWSEALLVLPAAGEPVLVVALTFRVKPWIERTSRVGEVIHSPRIGQDAARLTTKVAGSQARVGIVDLDRLPAGISQDFREAAPDLVVTDASELFATLRTRPDPAEIMLATRAGGIANRALAAVPKNPSGTGEVTEAVEVKARTLGAEEIYVAVAADLDRDLRLMRIEGEWPLGQIFAVRASVAYKGSWVRSVRSFARAPSGEADARWRAAAQDFAQAVALLPDAAGFSQCESFLVEGCRLSQPLEPLMGSRLDAARPPGPGALVTVQACMRVNDKPVLIGASALLGQDGSATALLGPLD